MSVYRGLLRLYPRAFREEYGEDMELLLQRQLHDEPAVRVWARTLLDLAITVPSLRLEARMSQRTAAPVLYGSATVACLVLTALSGTAYGVGTAGLLAVVVFATLAFLSWRRARALGDGRHAAMHWWKYVAAGVAGLGTCVVVANVGGELPEGTWVVWMGALLTSLVLTAVGVVLGLSHVMAIRRTS